MVSFGLTSCPLNAELMSSASKLAPGPPRPPRMPNIWRRMSSKTCPPGRPPPPREPERRGRAGSAERSRARASAKALQALAARLGRCVYLAAVELLALVVVADDLIGAVQL